MSQKTNTSNRNFCSEPAEIQLSDLPSLKNCLTKTKDRLGSEQIAKAIVLLGPTGCGKTTFMNLLLNEELLVEKSDNGGFTINQKDENKSKEPMMTIGNDISRSTTKFTNKADVIFDGQKITVLDFAGFLDSNDYQEIINCFARKTIFNLCEEVSFILLLDEPTFRSVKAGSAECSIASFLGTFKDIAALKQVLEKNALSIVLSKASNINSHEYVLKYLKDLEGAFTAQGELAEAFSELVRYLKSSKNKIFIWEDPKETGAYKIPKFVTKLRESTSYCKVDVNRFKFALSNKAKELLESVLNEYLDTSKRMFDKNDSVLLSTSGSQENKITPYLDNINSFFEHPNIYLRYLSSETITNEREKNDKFKGNLAEMFFFTMKELNNLINELKVLADKHLNFSDWLQKLKEKASPIHNILRKFQPEKQEDDFFPEEDFFNGLEKEFINHVDLVRFFLFMIDQEGKRKEDQYPEMINKQVSLLEKNLHNKIEKLSILILVPGAFDKNEKKAEDMDFYTTLLKEDFWDIADLKFTANLIKINCNYHIATLWIKKDQKEAIRNFLKALEIIFIESQNHSKNTGYPISQIFKIINGILLENNELIDIIAESKYANEVLSKLTKSNLDLILK